MGRQRSGRQSGEAHEAISRALRRRGVEAVHPRHEGVLLPAARHHDAWYKLLLHYSFRLFLRDVIRFRSGTRVEQLARYCSLEVAEEFVRRMKELRLTRTRGGEVSLRDPQVVSFGPTLEWLVAEMLRREFGMVTAWGLRPAKTSGGGDYDVVALADGALWYIETKSAAPRNIEASEPRAFVRRLAVLAPDAAVFLNDTKLRMLDKLVPAIQEELDRTLPQLGRLRRLQGETFVASDRLFVTNSDPELAINIGVCLAHFYRARSGIGAPPGQ